MAADGFVSVSFPALAAAQQELNKQALDLMREIEDLERALKPVAEMWTGDASNNYDTLKKRIETAGNRVFADIQTLSQLVGKANESQQENERRLAAQFGG